MAGYEPRNAPARGGTGGESRFATTTSPAGQNVTVQEAILLALQPLLADRLAEAQTLTPEKQTIQLQKIGRTSEGDYVLVPLRSLAVVPDSKPVTTGRYARRTRTGGDAVDHILLGEDWKRLRPEDVAEAFRECAEMYRFEGRALRRLSELLCLTQLARAGVTSVRSWSLPL
jgi:hypothetical protein